MLDVQIFKKLENKKVTIGVAFGRENTSAMTEYYEGVVTSIGLFGEEHFIVLDDDFMINIKYVQTIEIMK